MRDFVELKIIELDFDVGTFGTFTAATLQLGAIINNLVNRTTKFSQHSS